MSEPVVRDALAVGVADLAHRWAGRRRFTVLCAGADAIARFVDLGVRWRTDAHRCTTLHCIVVVAHMPRVDELPDGSGHGSAGAAGPFARELTARWPAATSDTHRLEFDAGRLRLLVVVGAPDAALRELVASVDAMLIGPVPSSDRLGRVLARLAAPGAVLQVATRDAGLRGDLGSAGFIFEDQDGAGAAGGGMQARYQPRVALRRPPGRQPIVGPATRREAVVVGAGLAGCAVVDALAALGWRCTLLDRHAQPAAEASGNPAGIFHGVVHASDGPHARFNRAAALEATRAYRELLGVAGAGESLGCAAGLLRIGTALPDLAAMQRLLRELQLPPDYVQALDPAAASQLAGLSIRQPAWFYPGGGWMRPARVARAWLHRAGAAVSHVGGAAVHRIARDADGDGDWHAFGPTGAPLASAPLLVLANADGARTLLDQLAAQRAGAASATSGPPLQRVRGQLTMLPHDRAQPAPRLALSGAGYLLPPVDGQLVFGATAQPGDEDGGIRAEDQRQNLLRLAGLSPSLARWRPRLRPVPLPVAPPGAASPATACRWSARCRSVGPAGPPTAPTSHAAIGREPGLLMVSGLGSRGLTWAPLAAQVLAALADGAPLPLPAALIDAIDPARFVSRATRRTAARAADADDGSA